MNQDDGASLCFTSKPLENDITLFGFPHIQLALSSDKAYGQVIVRLCIISPTDGTSILLSRGVLNLTHNHSHETPAPLHPNQPFIVKFKLNAVSCLILKGWRLRVGLSTSYWPFIWPSPSTFTLQVFPENSVLILPQRNPLPSILPDLGKSETDQPLDIKVLRPERISRSHQLDLTSKKLVYVVEVDSGRMEFAHLDRMQYDEKCFEKYEILENNPSSASVISQRECEFWRPSSSPDNPEEFSVRITSFSEMKSDETNWCLDHSVTAYEHNQVFFTKKWHKEIPRKHV